MAASEVTDLIAALRAGALTLDEVADRFRRRSWPRTRRPAPTTPAEMAESLDPEPDVPGSYDDLTAAYDRSEITREQYRTLVEAAADAIRAERQS
jgi:hypothetical protein